MNTIIVHSRPESDIDDDLIGRFALLPTAAISDALLRDSGAAGLSLIGDLPPSGSPSMAGRALTVRTRPGDNLALHVALDRARPGDVIVVDGGGHVRNALLGELIVRYAAGKGVRGIVVDGAVRDRAALRAQSLPVFALGVTHRGPYKSGPGRLHSPISVGGTVVNDGDVVVGDLDGVVVIPKAETSGVAAAAEEVIRAEVVQLRQINAGDWDRSWLVDSARIVPGMDVVPNQESAANLCVTVT